jgi:excisionase family DNA binding protein
MDKIILSNFTLEQLQSVIKESVSEILKPETHQTKEDETFITENDAVKILLVSKVTLCKWRKQGRIKFFRFGTRIRYRKSDLLKFAQEQTIKRRMK